MNVRACRESGDKILNKSTYTKIYKTQVHSSCLGTGMGVDINVNGACEKL